MTIVAKLTVVLSSQIEKDPRYVTPSADEHEHYRFVYNRQQMPLTSYKPSQIEAIPYHLLLLIFAGCAALLLLLTWLLTRKIFPWIARLRGSALVEEPEEPPLERDDLEVVPPSSDRNQRAADLQVDTDEKMQ